MPVKSNSIYSQAVPDQVRTLSQVGTSFYMAYADQVRTLSQVGTSSNMAQKVLTWSNGQLNSRCSFHVPCLFFVLYIYLFQNHSYNNWIKKEDIVHVFESEFASDIKDVTFMFIYIWFINICWEWPLLIEFAGGFIMFFIRGNKERSDGDQSIIGDISIRSSPKHSGWLTVTTVTPEKALKKVGSFYSKTPTLITETGPK